MSAPEKMVGGKWTPGPWACDEVRTSSGRAFRIGSGEMLEKGKGCCIIYDDFPGNPDNERAANARLIAAAPDMYEALASLVEQNVVYDGNFIRIECASHGDAIECVRHARAALAKATGGAK